VFRRIADFIWQRDMRRTIAIMRRVKSMFVKEGMTNVTIDVAQLEQRLAFLRDETRGRIDLKILEIGPWTGTHSLFIDRFFSPESLTFLERPGAGRDENFAGWIDKIQCKNKIIYSDLLLANELQGEKFDIIFCLGVIYHNVEYFKTCTFLRSLLKPDGWLVLGTVLSYDKKPSILIRYEPGQLYDVTRPSKKAMECVLDMTGFERVKSFDLPYPNQRGLFVCKVGEVPPVAVGGCEFGASTV
jgi:hypothetical protein